VKVVVVVVMMMMSDSGPVHSLTKFNACYIDILTVPSGWPAIIMNKQSQDVAASTPFNQFQSHK